MNYILWDYWIIGNKYFAIYFKEGKLYFSESTGQLKEEKE